MVRGGGRAGVGTDGPGRGSRPPARLPALPRFPPLPPSGWWTRAAGTLCLKRGGLHRSSPPSSAPPLPMTLSFFIAGESRSRRFWSRKPSLERAGRVRATASYARDRRPLPAGSIQKALKSQSSPGRAAPAAAYSARTWWG